MHATINFRSHFQSILFCFLSIVFYLLSPRSKTIFIFRNYMIS
nr:MAG TPA: hypothetical protein [Bacteriophage sp.]